MRTAAALVPFLLGICLTSPVAAQEDVLTGHWQGIITLVPAEREVDVTVEFGQAEGRSRGQLWYPLAGDGAHEVNGLTVQGDHVSFSVRDKAGVISAFEGDLSSDRAILTGMLRESGQSIPFVLRRSRATSPVTTVSTYNLSGDGSQLKETFNKDVGRTRILLLLDLGSFSAKMALRVVQRYVMDQIHDSELRAYVVWKAPNSPEIAKIARVLEKDAALATDPRLTHFWYNDPLLAATFEPMLAPYQPVSNPCLLFAPGRSWTEKPPLPDRLRQNPRMGAKTPVKPGQKLNGVELAQDVQTLLESNKRR